MVKRRSSIQRIDISGTNALHRRDKKENREHPPDASGRTSCQRRREERKNQTPINTKLQSPEDSKNQKLHSLKRWENKHPSPWKTPWGKTKSTTKEGRRTSPPSRRTTDFKLGLDH
jgi:hypothetical protein